jgi:2,3-bisphosphoglycerate-dependent phosphoglycerate mutase
LQGLNKQETVDKFGKDQVLVWRRSYDIPPPDIDEDSEYFPGNDPMYANVPKEDLPKAESLKLTEERFMTEWENVLVPEIKSGKKILIAAHGNTLRALVKHLDSISSDDITGLNIPTGKKMVATAAKPLAIVTNHRPDLPTDLESNSYSLSLFCSRHTN